MGDVFIKAFEIVLTVGGLTFLYMKGFSLLSSIEITWKK
jgi:hypothetical protein